MAIEGKNKIREDNGKGSSLMILCVEDKRVRKKDKTG
jgi:hypothetical protein